MESKPLTPKIIWCDSLQYKGGLDDFRVALILSALFNHPVILTPKRTHLPDHSFNHELKLSINIFKSLATATMIETVVDGYPTVVFNPHIDENPKPRGQGLGIILPVFNGPPAMYFFTVRPYVLFCRLVSRAIGNYQYYPEEYKFSLRVKRASHLLSSDGPSVLYLKKVFLPNFILLGQHTSSSVDLETNTASKGRGTELNMTIRPLVAPLKRRVDLTNREDVWRITAHARCPRFLKSRFKELLKDHMRLALFLDRGHHEAGGQEMSELENMIESCTVVLAVHVYSIRDRGPGKAYFCHVLLVAEALEPGGTKDMNNVRNNPEPTASYIGYELTCRLPVELVSELPDQRADAFIEMFIIDCLSGLRAELAHGHAVDVQQTWGLMSFYQLMAPSYVDWNERNRRTTVKEFSNDYPYLGPVTTAAKVSWINTYTTRRMFEHLGILEKIETGHPTATTSSTGLVRKGRGLGC